MFRACVAALACLTLAHAALAGEGLRAVHMHASHKELSSVLAAIDEKLKVLDTITAVQAKQSRRLDVIQDKLDRVETTLSIKLERTQLAVDRLEHRLHLFQTNVQMTIKEGADRLERSHSKVTEVAHNLTSHLDQHRHLLEKVSGSYAETWRRGLTLEGMVRDGFPLINVTRREMADGFRALARRQRDSRMTSGDLEVAFARRLNDTTNRLELKMHEVLDAQNSFLSSCKSQVQQDDPRQFTDVLEKILDSLIIKTQSTFDELQTIQTKIRNHDIRVKKLFNSQNEIIEAAFRNTSHSTLKEKELYQLSEKFVALTNRADAALQRLEKQLGDDGPVPASDVTAAADRLMYKLNRIKAEDEQDYDDWEEDKDQDRQNYFDEGEVKRILTSLKPKQSRSSGFEFDKDLGERPKSQAPRYADVGEDMMDEDKDILTGLEPKNIVLTTRAPHRRHLHKHPYDRGPG